MIEKREDSNSTVQQEIEQLVLAALSAKTGVVLQRERLITGQSYIELDGMWKDESQGKAIVVEVFAHSGRVRAAQRHKVQTDVFKLSLARKILGQKGFTDIEAIVAFVCDDCVKSVTGRTWVGDAAMQLGVSTWVFPLSVELQARLVAAQQLQNLMV